MVVVVLLVLATLVAVVTVVVVVVVVVSKMTGRRLLHMRWCLKTGNAISRRIGDNRVLRMGSQNVRSCTGA